jgi:hypothetical protein
VQNVQPSLAQNGSSAKWTVATPRYITSPTASILNSRLNFRRIICILQFGGHDFIVVSTKPTAVMIALQGINPV